MTELSKMTGAELYRKLSSDQTGDIAILAIQGCLFESELAILAKYQGSSKLGHIASMIGEVLYAREKEGYYEQK